MIHLRKHISRRTLFTLAFLAVTAVASPFLFYGVRLLQRPSRSTIERETLSQGVTYSRFLQQGEEPIGFILVSTS